MIDIHSHILYGIDDGAWDLNESIEIAKMAYNDGIKKIIATPHFIKGSYDATPDEIITEINILNDELRNKQIFVEILPGQEIFLGIDTAKNLKDGANLTLNNSKYVLIEFPMQEIPIFAEQSIYDLLVMGYQPIIAHPERIKTVIEDPCSLMNPIQKGGNGVGYPLMIFVVLKTCRR